MYYLFSLYFPYFLSKEGKKEKRQFILAYFVIYEKDITYLQGFVIGWKDILNLDQEPGVTSPYHHRWNIRILDQESGVTSPYHHRWNNMNLNQEPGVTSPYHHRWNIMNLD